ncbi:MAG: hypothetical protein WCT36_02245 [Candidatus Gracilibacteria bacterium]
MQFLHLYNQSPFKQKRAIWATLEDQNAVDVLKDEKGQKALTSIAEYKSKLDDDQKRALDSMQDRARNIISRMHQTWHPTAKGAIKQQIDEQVEANIQKKYEGGVTIAQEAHQGRLSRIFGVSIKKYEKVTERVNVCTNVVGQVEGEIKRAEELQRLYEQGMAYLRRGVIGKLRYPLVKKVTDPVSYRVNKKILENVRDIQADARNKKSDYEARIREKFGDARQFEGVMYQLISLYNPVLAGKIDKMLEDNAFKRNDDLLRAINALPKEVSDTEKKALIAMAKEQRGRKSRYSKAYERVGVEVGPEIKDVTKMAEAFGQLKIGNKFKIQSKIASVESDYRVQKIENRGGKNILVAIGPANVRVAFNLSDKKFTSQDTSGAYKTRPFADIRHLKITTK